MVSDQWPVKAGGKGKAVTSRAEDGRTRKSSGQRRVGEDGRNVNGEGLRG